MHNPNKEQILDGEIFTILEGFRREKLIKWFGISINTPEEGIALIEYCKKHKIEGLASIQMIYNVFYKENMERLFQLAKEENIAIITREVIGRGFLSEKYSMSNNFDKAPSAIKKYLKMYGKEQLILTADRVREIAKSHDLTTAQAALNYSVMNSNVTVTLIGLNRMEYFEEDMAAMLPYRNDKLIDDLNVIRDLVFV